MQRRLLTGAFGSAELRASVSYMPGEKVGFGSGSGAAVSAPAAETTASMMRDEMSRRLANTGLVSSPDWTIRARSTFARESHKARREALRPRCMFGQTRYFGASQSM